MVEKKILVRFVQPCLLSLVFCICFYQLDKCLDQLILSDKTPQVPDIVRVLNVAGISKLIARRRQSVSSERDRENASEGELWFYDDFSLENVSCL